jgi:hypothetical protein
MGTRAIFVAALVWAVLVVFAVHFLDFPGSVPNFQHVSGGGTLLDASPAFTADGVYQRLGEFGAEGRRNYWFRNLTVDILLPLSVLPFLLLLMRRAVTPLGLGRFLRVTFLALPLAYVAFDLLENSVVLVLLGNYPERLEMLAASLPYATIVKRIASLLAVGVPLTLLAVHSMRRAHTAA